jgi:multidrug efflux pump subunit AcrA (membrane-fusion protein)
MRSRTIAATGTLVFAAALVAGCAEVTATPTKYYEPYHVETPKASTDPKVVTFTEESARRAGVITVPVVQDGDQVVVPSASLIYEKSGASVVFISPEPFSYHRVPVEIAKDDGSRAWLAEGPAAGAQVVSTGANQVWGAEQGVGH